MTTLNRASSLRTPDSAYARWRPSLRRTLGAVTGGPPGVPHTLAGGGGGTAPRIHRPTAPTTDPTGCLFPAQPSTGALASSSIAAAAAAAPEPSPQETRREGELAVSASLDRRGEAAICSFSIHCPAELVDSLELI
nr:unnamed protein product [Digitaria exilis]